MFVSVSFDLTERDDLREAEIRFEIGMTVGTRIFLCFLVFLYRTCNAMRFPLQ